MNNIFIFTDNTADYPKDLWNKEKNIEVIPLAVSIGNDHYDFIDTFIDLKTFYDRLSAGEKCNTSMINEEYTRQRMTAILDKGFDIIYVAFSSALSGTYDCGARVAQELSALYPNQKISVVDSKAGSMGEGLLLYYVLKYRAEGMPYDQLVSKAQELSNHCGGYFSVGDLMHCAKMGRVSKTQAFIGTIIKIYPLMYINALGQLVPIEKIVTRKKLFNAMVDKVEEKAMDLSQQDIIMVGHSDCIDDAIYIKNRLQAKYGQDLNVIISDVGYVIGGHGGKNSIALFFLCKDKLEPKDINIKHLLD